MGDTTSPAPDARAEIGAIEAAPAPTSAGGRYEPAPMEIAAGSRPRGRTVDRWRQEVADRVKAATPGGARSALVRARMAERSTTARWRTLPDLLVIGGMRCGTSSLYKWLSRHPNVIPSLRKEVQYFTVDHAKGENWYRLHFPLELRRRAAALRARPLVAFEATVDLLFDPRAPARAHALVPDAKLIALLREPADRAVSHYHHMARLGHEPLNLEAALRAEDDRLRGELDRVAREPNYRATNLRRYSYVARGHYAEQLERWFGIFPRERLLVLRSEDMYARPAETYRHIIDFLELPYWEPPEFRNYSYMVDGEGDYPTPSDAAREILTDSFVEPNRKLVELLGDDFRWAS